MSAPTIELRPSRKQNFFWTMTILFALIGCGESKPSSPAANLNNQAMARCDDSMTAEECALVTCPRLSPAIESSGSYRLPIYDSGLVPGIDIGMGFNSLTQTIKQQGCVTPADIRSTDAQQTTYKLAYARNAEEFRNHMGFGVALAFDAGVFQSSIETHYSRAIDELNEDFVLFLSVVVQTGTRYTYEPALRNDDAKTLSSSFSRFLSLCGDEYITEIAEGGQFIAKITSLKKDSSFEESVMGALSLGRAEFSTANDLQTLLRNVHSETGLAVEITKVGAPDLPVGLVSDISTLEEVTDFAAEFQLHVEAGGTAPIGFTTGLYNFRNMETLPPVPNLHPIGQQFSDVAKLRDQAASELRLLQYADAMGCELSDGTPLSAVRSMLEQYLQETEDAWNLCSLSPCAVACVVPDRFTESYARRELVDCVTPRLTIVRAASNEVYNGGEWMRVAQESALDGFAIGFSSSDLDDHNIACKVRAGAHTTADTDWLNNGSTCSVGNTSIVLAAARLEGSLQDSYNLVYDCQSTLSQNMQTGGQIYSGYNGSWCGADYSDSTFLYNLRFAMCPKTVPVDNCMSFYQTMQTLR